MQPWPTQSSESLFSTNPPQDHLSTPQDGFHHRQPREPVQLPRDGSSGASPHSALDDRLGSAGPGGINAGQLDQELRRLSIHSGRSEGRPAVAGQRIIDYENAAMTPSTPKQALGFKVVKRLDPQPGAVQLTDFPNEILTHILSHLHPDSHAAVALLSKRFYALVTMPHAWRMAFLRYFPGHDALALKSDKGISDPMDDQISEFVRSEARFFARLTPLATWRSEYLLRTRLLRGLARGKPGAGSGIGSSTRSSKKVTAVLTFNSKLPWAVTALHAVFSNGKKPPRAVHGAAELGVATMSDPTVGKVEKWGFEDPFSASQLDEVFPELEPYGVSEGPAACPNVLDVSTVYGVLSGEGFPGGRAYFRPVTELCGRYLGAETGVVDTYPDIPKIPELSEAISSLWLAKSSVVPTLTQSMVGMLTGSTLGVVTAYAQGWDSSGARFSTGDMTARWVLSPGVPIVALKVDDQYNQRRKMDGRVWAVALNALGEVYYLTETPQSTLDRAKGEDVTKNAWYAGRTVYWQLIEHSRRKARPDDFDKNVIRGSYSPRSPSNAMELSKDQLVAEAREIEKFFRHKPVHFRKVCEGWDMRRKLEVDFASDDSVGAGEAVVVIECGWEKGEGPTVTRFIRSAPSKTKPQSSTPGSSGSVTPAKKAAVPVATSLFGSTSTQPTEMSAPLPAQVSADTQAQPDTSSSVISDWNVASVQLDAQRKSEITASALDVSLHSSLTAAEDPLRDSGKTTNPATPADGPVSMTPRTVEATAEIPGRGARMLALGTNTGVVLLWNMRESSSATELKPLRVVQTESPEISCLALNGLYLVHGGSDGLVQAWDPLASTSEPIRTLNARPSGRVPRHMLTMNPGLRGENYAAARAIFLDPDPTVLRGVMSFGAFLRYWSYSATTQPPGRKRRLRHSDIHGRLSSRRQGGKVTGYIAAEAAELRREQEYKAREQARLSNRFGVGAIGDLTEEEAIQYAQMMSEEAYQLDEQRRTSASDTGSAADASFDTSSYSGSTASTLTPEPSLTGAGAFQPPPTVEEESEYEMQVQQALRLSLLEGVNEHGRSPRGTSSGDYEVPITFKAKSSNKSKWSSSNSPSASYTPMVARNGEGSSNMTPSTQEEDDLALALKLSMEEHATHAQGKAAEDYDGSLEPRENFPPLEIQGKGKGRQM